MPDGIAEALVGQFLEYCRKRFGSGWDGVVQQVDRLAGADPAQRFECFLACSSRTPTGWSSISTTSNRSWSARTTTSWPPDPAAFGRWRTPALRAIWEALTQFARDTDKLPWLRVAVIARRFPRALVPVGCRLPTAPCSA